MMRWDKYTRYTKIGALLIGTTMTAAMLCGCQTAASGSKMTKSEVDNFKGGPMPADFMAKHPIATPPAAVTKAQK